jgi:hypothetical protein
MTGPPSYAPPLQHHNHSRDPYALQRQNQNYLEATGSTHSRPEPGYNDTEARERTKQHLKRKLDRIEAKNEKNNLTLKKGNSILTILKCLYAIEDINKDDHKEMFEQARLRTEGPTKTIIDAIRVHDKDHWTKFKNDLMTAHYGPFYTAEITRNLNRTRFDQSRMPYEAHAEEFDTLLKAINSAYDAAGATDADKGGMKNTFTTAWIAGLGCQDGRHALAATYLQRAKTDNPMTWEEVQDTAKTNQEVQGTKKDYRRELESNAIRREVQNATDSARINKEAVSRHHHKMMQDIRDLADKAKRTYKANMDQVQHAMIGSLTNRPEAPDVSTNRTNVETFNALAANAMFGMINPQSAAAFNPTNAMFGVANAQNTKNYEPPPPTLPPTNSATRVRRETEQPRNHGPRPGYGSNGLPFSALTLDRIRTGHCFQCGKTGHMAQTCKEQCGTCGALGMRGHLPTCKLHPRSFTQHIAETNAKRSGNGQARR